MSHFLTCNREMKDVRLVPMSATVPPNIKGEEVNATVMLGHQVELHCQSDAIPPPTLTWRKDGRPLFRKPGLTVSADGSVLKVGQVSASWIHCSTSFQRGLVQSVQT